MENRTSTVMKVNDVAVWSRFTGLAYTLTFVARSVPRCQTTLFGQSAEAKLSVRAHVFFSREGRMKVVKAFVRESVMLPIGTASYLM